MTSEIKPEDVKLPPMPQACDITPTSWSNLFSVDQMQAYARLAVLQERERAAKVCDERAQECRDSFDSDRDERWLVYEKHAKRLAAAIRAGHSITETPLGEG